MGTTCTYTIFTIKITPEELRKIEGGGLVPRFVEEKEGTGIIVHVTSSLSRIVRQIEEQLGLK